MLKKGRHASKKVVLVDCSSLTYAAFHTMGHLAYNGRRTGIIYGFLSRVLTMAEKFNTTNFIFCWDSGLSTNRIEAYPLYKAHRNEKREEFTPQEKDAYDSLTTQTLELNKVVLPEMGFRNSFMQSGFEADDLLGWWCNKMHKKDYEIIMVTSDADMYQCLDKCVIWKPTEKKFFTMKHMADRYAGTTPDQWAMAKAIGGCSGDGVIGIQGISDPKVKTSKVHRYLKGDLSKGVVVDRIKSKEGQKIIETNLPLVTVPYREDLLHKMILRKNYYLRKTFIHQFDKYHFVSFLKKDKLRKWIIAFNL